MPRYVNGFEWNPNWNAWGGGLAQPVPPPQEPYVVDLEAVAVVPDPPGAIPPIQNYGGFWAGAGAYAHIHGYQNVGWQDVNPLPQAAVNPVVPPPPPAPSWLDLPAEEGDMINDFKIGCDPEFMLCKDGRLLAANQYFPNGGEIGYDHGGRVAELRPGPSLGIMPIMRKLQDLINGPLITPIDAKLRAGAFWNADCLGGHIHFGFNCFTKKPPAGNGLHHGGELSARGRQVTDALDALTKILEHLDILPEAESRQRRGSGQGEANHYGAFGDVRDCHGHMEYRTMASWLHDPKVAYMCLTAAKCAASDPEGTKLALEGCTSFLKFRRWLEAYANKDVNAKRASEKLLDKGLKHIQVDPSVDFKGRWGELGV